MKGKKIDTLRRRTVSVLVSIVAVGFLIAPTPALADQGKSKGGVGSSPPGIAVKVGRTAIASPGLRGHPKVVPRYHDESVLLEKSLAIGRAVGPYELGVALEAETEEPSLAPSAPSVEYGPGFDGIDYTGWRPPDNAIAAGPNHIMQVVNSHYQFFSKSGGSIAGPLALSDFFDPIQPEEQGGPFDPRLLYDQFSDRWVMLALGRKASVPTSSSYLIAVSNTSDPTGTWCGWALDAKMDGQNLSNNWADFPGLGLDGQAVYITSNQFSFAGNIFQYSKIRILKKAELYDTNCPVVTWYDFWNLTDAQGTTAATIKPAHVFGTPPSIAYFVNARNPISPGVDYLTLWRIQDPTDFAPQVGSGPTMLARQAINATNYWVHGNATQLGEVELVETSENRIQNVIYRNGYIYFTHTVASPTGKCANSCVRAYKVRVSDRAVMWEEETGGSVSGYWHYYPALMVDNRENFFLVMNRSSSAEYINIRYYGRRNGQLPDATSLLKAGLNGYANIANGRNRWGDYSAAALDPSARCKVWLSGEYPKVTGDTWRMWITRVGYPQVVADFNPNMATNVSVYRPSNGMWYIQGASNARWGVVPGDIPVPGDYDGDGDTDIAIYRPDNGGWYLMGIPNATWGRQEGDIPVPGDYDGDCTTDIAIYRPGSGRWFIKGQSNVTWGLQPGDMPVPGDYDGDGDTDIAVFRPSNGMWYIRGVTQQRWGVEPGDVPVPGDYDGDGSTDIAIWRPTNGVWYITSRPNVRWGQPTDIPVPGDYDGDGTTDIAVYRPGSGRWFIVGQSNTTWGVQPGDRPLPVEPFRSYWTCPGC